MCIFRDRVILASWSHWSQFYYDHNCDDRVILSSQLQWWQIYNLLICSSPVDPWYAIVPEENVIVSQKGLSSLHKNYAKISTWGSRLAPPRDRGLKNSWIGWSENSCWGTRQYHAEVLYIIEFQYLTISIHQWPKCYIHNVTRQKDYL